MDGKTPYIIAGAVVLGLVGLIVYVLMRPQKSKTITFDSQKIRVFAVKLAEYYGTFCPRVLPTEEAVVQGQRIADVLRCIPSKEARLLLAITEEAIQGERYPVRPIGGSPGFNQIADAIGKVMRQIQESGTLQSKGETEFVA